MTANADDFIRLDNPNSTVVYVPHLADPSAPTLAELNAGQRLGEDRTLTPELAEALRIACREATKDTTDESVR